MRSLYSVVVIPNMVWIKLTGKERMISMLRWQMHGVAFYSMTHCCHLESNTGTVSYPEPLEYKRQCNVQSDEDMTLHAIINYCGKQCTDAPFS